MLNSALSQVVLDSGLTVIGQRMFYMGQAASLLAITIPSTVTSIGHYFIKYFICIIIFIWLLLLFNYIDLVQKINYFKNFVIIIYAGDNAFYSNSALTSVVLTAGLIVIGFQMFFMGQSEDKSSLQTLTIPSTVITYGDKCYYWFVDKVNYTITSNFVFYK